MITGMFAGFGVWLILAMFLYLTFSIVHSGKSWTFKPNYGGMLVLMIIGSAIGYFFF